MRAQVRHATHLPGRWRRPILVLVAVLVLLATGGAGSTAWAVWHLQGNITTRDITSGLGTDRPTVATTGDPTGGRPVNILVMGSDTREGGNGFIGGNEKEGHSDTTVLLHLAADGQSATAVSIPRDSLVTMPTCTTREGGTSPAALRMFNESYTIGGPACTVRTVEQLTKIRIDHYVVVDFSGFTEMVDALGSVEVCLPEAVDDPKAHLDLPAGRSRVSGDQALAYVRARYTLGDGGDLGRIDRQQAFLSSILQQATSTGVLTDPPRLYAFLNAATRSVTMDPQLAALPRLTAMAAAVHRIGLDHITFLTVPTGAHPADANRLQWMPAADTLWRAIRADHPVEPVPVGTGTAPDGPAVRVLNGSGTSGLGTRAAQQLRAVGVTVRSVGNTATTERTVIRYAPGHRDDAERIAVVLPGAKLIQRSGLGSTIQVVVGADWTPPAVPTPSGTDDHGAVEVSGASGRTASTNICAS
jgi:LCP family protein required for cell wall assembly